MSLKLLMVANGLTTEDIKIGQTLLVPYENPVTNDSPLDSSEDLAGTYTVKKGDTLFSLSKKFHISVNELIKENKLLSEKIYVGQKLFVPTEVHSKETEAVYTVAPGDSLWGIAKRFGVKVEDLKNVNTLISDGVIIGQKLHIPGVALFTEVEVIGAADSTTVEFDKNGDPLILTVPYGSASGYQELSGQNITIIHQNGALISII
nr:LysM peptidoglycan-binding domain-containing protein [Bacillus sp. T3]